MRIGWIGLGKLGLPCASVLAAHHTVWGYDVNPEVRDYLKDPSRIPYQERGLQAFLEAEGGPNWAESIGEVVEETDVIFVAVQTPHAPRFEGTRPLGDGRADFDYSYLTAACRSISYTARAIGKAIDLVVVSTVLPGTTRRLISPLCVEGVDVHYSPAFIAMGTTIDDFTAPEFVLAGSDHPWETKELLEEVYAPVHSAPVVTVSIESAELAKVAYNTYIGQKIVFANTMMEICHKTGADADEVFDALAHATDRLHSPRYLRGGMGDGGGCHPRDNIALSWLAQRLDLSVDWFEAIMKARDHQTEWLAELVKYHADVAGLPVVVLGKAYKAGTNLTVGSPARLLLEYLDLYRVNVEEVWDPEVDDADGVQVLTDEPAVFVIATNHPIFGGFEYAAGSIIVDPWGYITDRPGVTVIRVGRKS